MKNIATDVDIKSMATIASFIIAVLFLLGFSYISTYLRSFGFSTLEVSTTYSATVVHGILVLYNDPFLALILFLLMILIIFGTMQLQVWFGTKGLWIAPAILLPITCWFAIASGAQYGLEDAQSILTGDVGIAFCKLHSESTVSTSLRNEFEERSNRGEVRKIIVTRDLMYFTYQVENVKSDAITHSIAIKKSDIEFCRFVPRYS